MKILILTQYFPPEIGAPQNRLFELAVRLQKNGLNIDVFTAMPNYPQMEIHEEYRGKIFLTEKVEAIKVYRSFIYVSKSNSILARLVNYFSFVLSSFIFGLFKTRKYDFIFCESPPLFLGISAYLLCLFKRSKLIFNVSDLWPESAEKLDIISNKFLLKSATKLEEFLYKKSILVTGQTQGIVRNISERFPEKRVYWLPNGVDLSYYNPEKYDKRWREKKGFEEDNILLAYAGIHGYAQGLEIIIKAANLLKSEANLKFIMIGNGPEKEMLIELNRNLGNENVYFYDAITKQEMPYFVSSIDVSIVPLKNIPLFEGAIPSKVFENLAMEKAILLGVKGEAKKLFIDDGNAGETFIPENENSLKEEILKMVVDRKKIVQFGKNGRKYVQANFNRDLIVENFLVELKKL